MSGVEAPPTVPSEDIVRYKADACLSNALVKTGLSFSAGVLASVVLFKRTCLAPLALLCFARIFSASLCSACQQPLTDLIVRAGRAWPVWIGTGFGVGQSWTECERSFNPTALPGVRIVPSVPIVATPEGATPGAQPVAEPVVDAVFPSVVSATTQGAAKTTDAAQHAVGKTEAAAGKAGAFAKDSANDLLARAHKATEPNANGKHIV